MQDLTLVARLIRHQAARWVLSDCEIPYLKVNLVLENHSLYRDVRVDRLIVSISEVFSVVHEGWAVDPLTSAETIQISASLTTEQAAWLKKASGRPFQLRGIAKLVCDGRSLQKSFHLTGNLNAPPYMS